LFRFDINQGRLGDCWFLASVASLTLNPILFNMIIPANQNLNRTEGYTGAVAFRFLLNLLVYTSVFFNLALTSLLEGFMFVVSGRSL